MNTSLVAYTYILRCSNGAYYVGSTNDLERRLAEHQSGQGSNFTRKHLPVELIYWEEYQTLDDAFRRERQLHGWSRAKKEALINGDIEKLKSASSGGPSTSSGTAIQTNPEPVTELVEVVEGLVEDTKELKE